MKREEQEKPIKLPIAIFLIIITVFFDAIELTLIFIGLDDFFLLDMFAFPTIQISLIIIGALIDVNLKWGWSLGGNIIELIPYAGWLPFRTISALLTIFFTNHQKIASIAQKVSGASGKTKSTQSNIGDSKITKKGIK